MSCCYNVFLYLCIENSIKIMEIKGVITGDIIRSSQIKPEFRGDLLTCLTTMGDDLQCISPFRMELYRGDSFQLLVEDPTQAIKIAILLRAGLIYHTPNKEYGMWDAKVSIGIGSIDFISDSIVTSDGEAFMYSGRQLDGMGKDRLSIQTPWQDVNEELGVSTAFVDDIITRWSSKQAGMIYLSLRQNSAKKEVAEMSGTSIQNVRNVLSVAKESLIKKYIERNAEIITAHINTQQS